MIHSPRMLLRGSSDHLARVTTAHTTVSTPGDRTRREDCLRESAEVRVVLDERVEVLRGPTVESRPVARPVPGSDCKEVTDHEPAAGRLPGPL